MRTKKFRAWDKVNKRMGYFKPGFGWNDEYYLWHLKMDGKENICDVPCEDNIELMQFTGLHDKNVLEELFEGDIIDSEGQKRGNKYETPSLLTNTANLLIEGLGTKTWRDTEQKAMGRGCKYSE